MSNAKCDKNPTTVWSGRIACLLALLAAWAAASGQIDEMIPMTLELDGQVENIPFELEAPAIVEIWAFFPPAEVGAVKFVVTDAEGREVNVAPPRVAAAGKYNLAVSSAGKSTDSFNVKIGTSEPLDRHEPNDTRQTAATVELPLRTNIELHGRTNPDWFRFKVGQPYVLSVHVQPGGGAKAHFAVTDAEGKELYKTSNTWDYSGARYVRVTPGEYCLKIWQPYSGPAYAELELALYAPSGGAGNRGGFIAVGMKSDSPDLNQLSIIAGTSGVGLIETISPEIMKAELVDAVAIKEKSAERAAEEGGSAWVVWIIVLAVLAAGGAAAFWCFRKSPEHRLATDEHG